MRDADDWCLTRDNLPAYAAALDTLKSSERDEHISQIEKDDLSTVPSVLMSSLINCQMRTYTIWQPA